MAKSLNQAELDLNQYLPERKLLVREKLAELSNTYMPTIGQLLGLILGEDQALLKMAQSDVTGKINLFDADAKNIAGQITNTDAGFRDKITRPILRQKQFLQRPHLIEIRSPSLKPKDSRSPERLKFLIRKPNN